MGNALKTKDSAEFLTYYGKYTDREVTEERINKHIQFKTIRIVLDFRDNTIAAMCLWNISSDGLVAQICDMVIREDYRNNDLMRWILRDGIKIWPVKWLEYNRDYNDDGHDRWEKPKRFSVEKFLRRSHAALA